MVEWAREATERGAGEILLTSMDRDGTSDGYDLKLTAAVSAAVGVPVIASGGAGELSHLVEALAAGADAALCASIFHYGRHTIAEAKEHLARRHPPCGGERLAGEHAHRGRAIGAPAGAARRPSCWSWRPGRISWGAPSATCFWTADPASSTCWCEARRSPFGLAASSLAGAGLARWSALGDKRARALRHGDVEWKAGRIDIATARRSATPHPGALPEVEPASLAEDLLRRDFTVNALALALDGRRPGELRAAPGAFEDLRAGRLRVLHERSFLDDPTRLWRLARYERPPGVRRRGGHRATAAAAVAGRTGDGVRRAHRG